MKTRNVFAILILSVGVAAAQDNTAEQLRKAIVEEEANRDLNKAIQAYQAILTRFDKEREIAAAAAFHLAECYRKQAKKEQAIAAYKRVIREFADQKSLADASRRHLSRTYGLSQDPAVAAAVTLSESQFTEARRKYRALLHAEIGLIEDQIREMGKRVEVGTVSPHGPEMFGLKRTLLELQRTLAAFDAGAMPIPTSTRERPPRTPDN